jgi:hypothetical protein
MRWAAMLLAGVTVLAITGCSDRPVQDEPDPSARSTTAPGDSSAPPAPSSGGSSSVRPSAPGSLPPSASAGETTLRGTVMPGVEPGCLTLAAGGQVYLLLGGGPAVRAGARVEVRGRVEKDMLTTCQQGVPFRVSQVREA